MEGGSAALVVVLGEVLARLKAVRVLRRKCVRLGTYLTTVGKELPRMGKDTECVQGIHATLYAMLYLVQQVAERERSFNAFLTSFVVSRKELRKLDEHEHDLRRLVDSSKRSSSGKETTCWTSWTPR